MCSESYHHTTSEYTMDADQSMKQFLENFVSNCLPDEEIEDNGVPTHKVSALRKYVVDELINRLEDMFENEIDHIKRESDEDLFEMFQEEEDDSDKKTCDVCSYRFDIAQGGSSCKVCDIILCERCFDDRPEIFGKEDDWQDCEVCLECQNKFDDADDEAKKKIIKAMKQKEMLQNEPYTE
jgi:hypothetical protein